MRPSPRLSLSIVSLLVLSSACMGPQYPDEFGDLVQPATTADAALPLVPDAGQMPGLNVGTGGTAGTGGIGNVGGTGGTGSVGGTVTNDAGSVAPPRDSGTPIRDAATAPEASVSVEAGIGSDGGGSVVPGGTVSSCTITATTDASTAPRYRGEYGCAVWIANASNKVVKAFLVATVLSFRSGVPTYRSQASGVMVDVTTSATLSAPRQHKYTWNAASAPAGKYSLNIETHSENGTKVVTVPFDTSNGPVSAMGTPNADTRAAAIDCK